MSAESNIPSEKINTADDKPIEESTVEKTESVDTTSDNSKTNPEQKAVVEKAIQKLQPPPDAPVISEPAKAVTKRQDIAVTAPTPKDPPWTLQQFFDDEIDLDVELATRFQNMPVMSVFKSRGLGSKAGRGVATISTPDGSAQVSFDADSTTKTVQVSFTFGSMLTLRFTLDTLTDANRDRWLALMRRQEGGLAFLWGPTRWESDYMISISRQYHTNLYAFSPNNFEAATRVTPEVRNKLLDWLDGFWKHEDNDEEQNDTPDLLTW